MNILLLGSGGREHALAWKISQSPLLSRLFVAPGNAGTAALGTNLPLAAGDFAGIRQAVIEHGINMLVVGPEDPLVNGIHDFFLADPLLRGVPVIGPRRDAARLEGSKDFAKEFMLRHGIPTARHRTFGAGELDRAIDYLHTIPAPYVLKADGLAAGKGVVICPSLDEAERELTAMLRDARFGEASQKVVIEEFLDGIELSVFVITDGHTWQLLPEAKDYKKVGEGDTGPNTGGMGSVSPVPFAGKSFMEKVKNRIIEPTLNGLRSEAIDYTGFLFFGLIRVGDDPYVIEYNCRLGDPETESVLPRIGNDLIGLLSAVAHRTLDRETIACLPQAAATIMLVSAGYPGDYEKGKVITGEENAGNCLVFHAGTRTGADGRPLTSGGRVMAVTCLDISPATALASAVNNAERIRFEGKYFRRDIGFDLVW